MQKVAKTRDLLSFPADGSFYEMLHWLLFQHGTRPDGKPVQVGKKVWSRKEFAAAVHLELRTVSNWLKREDPSPPHDLASVEQAIFGDNPAYAEWRASFRAAYNALDNGYNRDFPAQSHDSSERASFI